MTKEEWATEITPLLEYFDEHERSLADARNCSDNEIYTETAYIYSLSMFLSSINILEPNKQPILSINIPAAITLHCGQYINTEMVVCRASVYIY